MKKVLVVHRHERCEGSTILAVVPATKAGRQRAELISAQEKNRPGFMSCDTIEIEEHKIEEAT